MDQYFSPKISVRRNGESLDQDLNSSHWFCLFGEACINILFVTYWPLTEPSIKKQEHPVEDIGISPWLVDLIEFYADTYAHRKQVNVKQLYNQVPQTAWGVQLEFELQLEIRCWSENQLQTEGLGPQDPGWAAQQNEEKCCYGQRKLGSISDSPALSLTQLSHITNINPFANLSRIKCEWNIFYKEMCSFVIYVDYISACICIRIVISWLYNILNVFLFPEFYTIIPLYHLSRLRA